MNTTTWTFTDGTTLPIGTMYCIGRNYAAHASEMGAALPTSPLVFLKPPSAYMPDGSTIALPSWSTDVHHEVELVVVIGPNAMVAGYGVGLDLTARDVQAEAKRKGEPWATSKAWKGSAPVSSIVPAATIGTREHELAIALDVDGNRRQGAAAAAMERSVQQLVAYVDGIFGLREGDCLFTGTPEGVARLEPGNAVRATLSLDSVLASLSITIAEGSRL